MPNFAIHKYLFLFLGTTWDIYLFQLDDFRHDIMKRILTKQLIRFFKILLNTYIELTWAEKLW